jgi:hypothetical protein
MAGAGAYLLRVQSDDKRGNVDHLLADTDVPLPDENSGVVDGLGETVKQQNPHHQPLFLRSSPSIFISIQKHPTHPLLKTWVCNLLSKKSSTLRAKT